MRPPAFTRTQVHSDRHTSTSPTPPKKPTLRALKPAHKYFNGHSHSSPGATEPLQHDDKVDIVSGLPLTYALIPNSRAVFTKGLWSSVASFRYPAEYGSKLALFPLYSSAD
jgi:hypothetical protein